MDYDQPFRLDAIEDHVAPVHTAAYAASLISGNQGKTFGEIGNSNTEGSMTGGIARCFASKSRIVALSIAPTLVKR
jgi:hypothetical protein